MEKEQEADISPEAKAERLKAVLDAMDAVPYRHEKHTIIAYLCTLHQTYPNKPD